MKFGRIPWTNDQPVARPLPTQGNTTQKHKDKHPCLERDSNPRSEQPSGQDLRLRPHGHRNWLSHSLPILFFFDISVLYEEYRGPKLRTSYKPPGKRSLGRSLKRWYATVTDYQDQNVKWWAYVTLQYASRPEWHKCSESQLRLLFNFNGTSLSHLTEISSYERSRVNRQTEETTQGRLMPRNSWK
jgi:hypothetical protein